MTTLSIEMNRAALTQLANDIRINGNERKNDIARLRTLQNMEQPESINRNFQEELVRLHSLFQRLVVSVIHNIQAQTSIRALFYARLIHELNFEPLDREAIDQMLQEKLTQINDLEKDLRQMLTGMGMLRNRVMTLTSVQNPNPPLPGLWDIIDVHLC